MACSFVVPSAGYARRLFPLSSNTPKILIKLNGVPLFSLLYKQALAEKCVNFIIAISKEFEHQLKTFVDCNYANAPIPIIIRVVDDPSAGVLYSVLTALQAPECAQHALIVLSDTFYNAPFPKSNSYVIYKQVPEPVSRWCLIDTLKPIIENVAVFVTAFHDKPIEKVNTNKALIGVYKVYTDAFKNSGERIIASNEKRMGEFQLSQAFQEYQWNGHPIEAFEAVDGAWHDTGTLETLRDASNNFFLSRCFNHIKIEDGYLIKSSNKKEVIQKQYLWYQNFEHKDLIPAIYGYSETPEKAQIKMELCAMPDLGTFFNYCISEPVFFEQVISSLLNTLTSRIWKNQSLFAEQIAVDANEKMWLEKTWDRLHEMEFNQVSHPFPKWAILREYLEEVCKSPIITPIHGDLILSNILFDPQRMTFKLIDPRGSYGNLGLFGDLRYELAKLLHSVDGKYESVIHDLYRIKDGQVIFYMSEDKKKCFEAAQEVIYKFAETKCISRKEIQAIEIILFLSMLPLHSENKSHQEAFYLIAIKLLENWYEKYSL